MVYIVSKTPIILHGFAIIYVAWCLMSLFREPLWATTMFEPTSCTDSKPMGNRILLTKRPPAPHANLQIFTFMYIAYINMYIYIIYCICIQLWALIQRVHAQSESTIVSLSLSVLYSVQFLKPISMNCYSNWRPTAAIWFRLYRIRLTA